MDLQAIETLVLTNIGYDRYSALSVDTGVEKTEDFATLHRCVHLARDEIKLNCMLPGTLKRSSGNATVAGTKSYNAPSDMDVVLKVRYRTASSEFDLSRVYPENLLTKLGGSLTTATGMPSMYMIFGNSSNVIQIEFHLIPDKAAQYDVEYKPILINLTTNTDEDVIMQKYPQTVIKLATAYAFQFFKKDMTNFAKWFALGSGDFATIDHREQMADANYKEIPDAVTRTRRQKRFSK